MCKNKYHIDCESISDKRFYIMEPEKREMYKCRLCRSELQRTADNDLDDQDNITFRKKFKVNVPTNNSFEVLSEEDEIELGDVSIT